MLAAAPALADLVRGLPVVPVARLQRNVALHAATLPRPGSPAAAWRQAQHGPRLGAGTSGGMVTGLLRAPIIQKHVHFGRGDCGVLRAVGRPRRGAHGRRRDRLWRGPLARRRHTRHHCEAPCRDDGGALHFGDGTGHFGGTAGRRDAGCCRQWGSAGRPRCLCGDTSRGDDGGRSRCRNRCDDEWGLGMAACTAGRRHRPLRLRHQAPQRGHRPRRRRQASVRCLRPRRLPLRRRLIQQ